jgi:hypothetical protein
MIQDPSKELTLIVYNTPKPPKYLKLNKGLIKTLIIVIPLLIISSISISFLYSMYLKNQVNDLRSKEPKIINDLKEDKIKLQSTVKMLEKSNSILTKKLSIGATAETSLSSIGLFTAPLGMEDLREKELLKMEGLKLETKGSNIEFSFNLANNSPDKLSGFLFIVQYQGNQIQFYPNYELGEKNLRLEFSKGESFSFSRFRPTVANFTKTTKSSARYKVFIFSRTGNLIAYKQAGPFNIE